MTPELRQWLARPPREELSRKLRAAAWVVSAAVLALVGSMQRIHLSAPAGWDMGMLPPFHAILNTLTACALVTALVAIKRGKPALHRAAMVAAMSFSIMFLLSYVTYHTTTPETRYGGAGAMRAVYLVLLASHILAAAASLPFILFTFIAGWTNRFAAHRRLARRVFPVWLYVAITGPLCYLMLRPYY